MQLNDKVQHVYLVGAKSLGAYGGYETFVYKLTEYPGRCESIAQELNFKKRLRCPCCNIKECVIIWATKQLERGHYESDSMAVKTDAGDDDPAADPCRVAGKVVCGVSVSLFGMGFLSAG